MRKIINLDNNYIMKILNEEEERNNLTTNIQNLKFSEIKQKEVLILNINFKKINKKDYKKILKHLLAIRNKVKRNKVKIGISDDDNVLLGYVFNYDERNEDQKDFIKGVNAVFFNTRFKRYNYIYDEVCNYLDNYFYGKNLCDFQNNKCGEKRNTNTVTGCCHHFKNKALGPFSKMVLCEYLNKETYTCDAKCLSCKLFTCDYLRSKGIQFKIKDILLLDTFFNPLQKYFIKYMVFTPKEKILRRLMLT